MPRTFEDKALRHLTNSKLNKINIRLLSQSRETIIPFVGAGLSADFGYPPWHRLIEDLAETAGMGNEVKPLLGTSKFEEAAELICSRLPNQFDDALRDTFNSELIPRPIPRCAARHVPQIGRGIVLTTNFDCVLETVFEQAQRPFKQVFSGTRIREASRAVQLNERCLLKLHGDYRDSERRILTLSEYSQQYGGTQIDDLDFSLPLPTVLGQALASRPILFLGCSLKTDRTMGVINSLAKRYPGVIHFALLSAEEMSPERLKQLDNWNIRPLFFAAGQFNKVEAFLGCLAQNCRVEETTVAQVGSDGSPAKSAAKRQSIRTQQSTGSGQPMPMSLTPLQRPLRINGYKMFYFRRMRKIGRKVLGKLVGVKESELWRLERVNDRTGALGSHCFQMCDREVLRKIEDTLECRGQLTAGMPDDFLTHYMLFYRMYRGTSNSKTQDEDQLEMAFDTKAVVFDFDGTLTARNDDETTWEKIWVKLGYSINDCAELHHKYSLGRFNHQQWCEITRDKFREAGFRMDDLKKVAQSIVLINGIRETLEHLRGRGIKLYILSGSIRQIINEVLGDLRGWFEEVHANDILFETTTGLIKEIRGTRYDFEGKAKFLSRVIEDNAYSPFDVLFVGNSCNDIFASRSGARTLCVNPRATNPDNKEHWTYLIRRMDNLAQILRFAEL